MRRQIMLRWFIIVSLIVIMSLLLLVSSNFSEAAMINMLGTLVILVLLPIIIAYFILRKNH